MHPSSTPDRLRSTDTATCVVRRSNNSFGDRCFAAAGPRLWNTLPVQLRHCDSLGQFKRLLKTYLFGGCRGPRRFVTLVRSAVYKLSYLLTYLPQSASMPYRCCPLLSHFEYIARSSCPGMFCAAAPFHASRVVI